jgi:uncharacterized protein with von Willebrand factor type A (vWA) domain
MENGQNGYQEIKVEKVEKLSQKENLNIALVADISGSMYEQIDETKSAIVEFVDNIQFAVGDKASLISFDSYVYEDIDFSNNKSNIQFMINSLHTGSATALYDALYVAISKTAQQQGAKGIIAFTDGCDNVSYKSKEDVISLAKAYQIPIYMIGIGDVDDVAMKELAEQTGGFYEWLADSSSLKNVYEKIYTEQKELYLLEYETPIEANTIDSHNIYLKYKQETCVARCITNFSPKLLQEKPTDYTSLLVTSQLSGDEIETEVEWIRKIYNEIQENKANNYYTKENVRNGVTAFYDEYGNVISIEVAKETDGIKYARYYYYHENKLIFCYMEGEDSHRLYFHDESLFRWRYAKNAVNYSEAQNHDNEDSEDFRKWGDMSLKEGKELQAEAK